MNAASQVASWIKQAPETQSRWPGFAVRNRKNEIDFRKGRVIAVTDLSITVEMDHPFYKAVKLMGESYAHYCRECTRTIPGNVTYRRSADSVMHKGREIPIRFFCPFCGPDHMLRMIEVGDWLRLHYRAEKDGSSGAWFGEVWCW
jgi:hypothetical protein